MGWLASAQSKSDCGTSGSGTSRRFQALDRNQNQLLQVLTSLAKTSAEQRQLSGKNLF